MIDWVSTISDYLKSNGYAVRRSYGSIEAVSGGSRFVIAYSTLVPNESIISVIYYDDIALPGKPKHTEMIPTVTKDFVEKIRQAIERIAVSQRGDNKQSDPTTPAKDRAYIDKLASSGHGDLANIIIKTLGLNNKIVV